MRALDVLEHFGFVRQPLRAKDIVREFDLRPSSADQLLKTMVEAGYLVFDPVTKLYDLSFRLATFAGWLSAECFPAAPVGEVLDELHASTGAGVFVAQRTDNFMRVVDARVAEGAGFGRNIGGLLPFDAMTGQAFLASCEEDETRRIVDHAALHRHLPRDSAITLVERVRGVRAVGHAAGARYSLHLWSVSAPLALHPTQRTRTLVLSVTGGKDHVRRHEDRIVRLVREGAAAILGGAARTPRPWASPVGALQ